MKGVVPRSQDPTPQIRISVWTEKGLSLSHAPPSSVLTFLFPPKSVGTGDFCPPWGRNRGQEELRPPSHMDHTGVRVSSSSLGSVRCQWVEVYPLHGGL